MQKGSIKGLKPIIIKQIALLIGICYLMNPLQQQIKTILHEVSHALASPNHIMSHSAFENNNESHGHDEHQTDVMKHDHSMIDLIDSVFKASKESNDSEDSMLIEIKIDKHITTYQFQLVERLRFDELHSFWTLQKKQKKGHFEKRKEPPQYFLS